MNDIRVIRGPNGLIEVKQFNAVQGWHSGYLDPKAAIHLAQEIKALADELQQRGKDNTNTG